MEKGGEGENRDGMEMAGATRERKNKREGKYQIEGKVFNKGELRGN